MEVESDSQHSFFSSRHDFGSPRQKDRKKQLIEPPCFGLEETYSGKQHIESRTSGFYLRLQTVLHWSLLSRYCTLRSLCLNQGCSGQKYLWSLVASWGSRLFCIRHGFAIMPSQPRRASVASQEIYDLDKLQELGVVCGLRQHAR